MSEEAGYKIFDAGLGFAGAMRDQRRYAMAADAIEREKSIDAHAAKLTADDSYLKQIPEDQQYSAMVKAANFKAQQIQNDAAYRKAEGDRFLQDHGKLQQNLQAIEALTAKGDYKSAVPLMQQSYKLVRDGWDIPTIQWEDEATNTPGKVTFKNQYTGEEREEAITPDNINKSVQYLKKYAEDPKLNATLAAQDKAWWMNWNNEQASKAKIVRDANGKEMGALIESVGKDADGNFDPTNRKLILLQKGKGAAELPNGLPDGWQTDEQIKADAGAARSQFETKKATLAGANLETPELDKAFLTQGGQYLAPNAVGGYVPVNPSMVKQEKAHFIGGTFTDEGGNVQALAQTNPYSTRLTKVNTEVKVAPKEGSQVSVQDPATGKQMLISKGQAKQLDNQLKMAKELLANVKDDKGNSLSLLLEEPSDMNPKKGEMLVDKLNRIIQDPKASKEAKHAADSAKFVYQAYGVMPLDRKGATGKGGTAKQEAPPSAFKQGWDLYGSLKGYPEKQKALLEGWRNSGDPGAKKVVEQIESILKKTSRMEETATQTPGGEDRDTFSAAISDVAGGVVGLGSRYYGTAKSGAKNVIDALNAAGESKFVRKMNEYGKRLGGGR